MLKQDENARIIKMKHVETVVCVFHPRKTIPWKFYCMNTNNQHQAHLSLDGRFNCMRGCFHVRTLIFQNDCLSISAPAYANQNVSFLHQTFTIEVSGRGVVSLPFIATAQSQTCRRVELYCCCCVRRSHCKIMLVLSVSEALDPCGLCLAPSFMGFEEN